MGYTRHEYHCSPETSGGMWECEPDTWRNSFNKKGSYIGVEFEIEPNDSYRTILSMMPELRGRNRPLVETDGSLSREGIEIVFPPFLSSTLKKSTSAFARTIAAIKNDVHTTYATGMHMNINTEGWSQNKKLRFCALIHNMPESYLVNIGQRQLTEYCERRPGLTLRSYEEISDHTNAAEILHNRIECRFPGAILDHSRFQKLVEFFETLDQYCTPENLFDGKTTHGYSPVYNQYEYEEGHSRWDWDEDDEEEEDDGVIRESYTQIVEEYETWMCKTMKRKAIYNIMKAGYK